MTSQDEATSHGIRRVLGDFLVADDSFRNIYYSLQGPLVPAFRALDDVLDPSDVLYVWPELQIESADEESGAIHVLTRSLVLSAGFKEDSASTVEMRPLNLTGLDVTASYNDQYGTLYLMNYELAIHRGPDAWPLKLKAKYATDEFLTSKLRSARAALQKELTSRPH